jgi:NADPH2:quinone reductase
LAEHAVALDQSDPAGAIRGLAPKGVDRVVEVALSDNADLDAAVVANDAVVAAYATRADRTEIPFWPLLFANVTLRLLGSDDFTADAKQQAARDLTSSAAAGALHIAFGQSYPLHDVAEAHDHVDAGTRGRILIEIPQ